MITIVCSLLSFVLSVDRQKLQFWALLFVKQQFKATLEQSYIDRYVLTMYCRSSSGDIRNLKQWQWQRQRQWKLHPKIVFVGFQISFFFPTLALLVCHRWPIFSGVEFGISWTLLMICGFQSKRFGSRPTNHEGGSIWWHNTATCISLMYIVDVCYSILFIPFDSWENDRNWHFSCFFCWYLCNTFLCLSFQITSQVGPSTGMYDDDHLIHVTFSCSLTL